MLPLALEMGEEGGQVSTSVELDWLFPELDTNPGLKTAPWREGPRKAPNSWKSFCLGAIPEKVRTQIKGFRVQPCTTYLPPHPRTPQAPPGLTRSYAQHRPRATKHHQTWNHERFEGSLKSSFVQDPCPELAAGSATKPPGPSHDLWPWPLRPPSLLRGVQHPLCS